MANAQELRRARERTSIFGPFFQRLREERAALAAEGRRPVLGGLLSKEPVMGTDTIRYEGVGPMVRGILEPLARGVDAPRAAAAGLIPDEDMIGEAFGTAGAAMGASAMASGKGALSYDPTTTRIFLGQKASNADLSALKKARELSARRRSRDEIWNETGWFKGADGEWRFEIDDSKAVLRQNASDTLNSGGADYQTNYAGGVLHQPLLGGSFRGQSFNPAYRDMIGDMDFSREGRPSGSFDTDTGRIKVSAPDAREGLPIALHELQHAVQKQEGFARGSNPSFELNELLTKRNDRLREISSKIDAKKSELGLNGYQPKHPELNPLYDEYNSLVGRAVSEDQAYQNYIRTAGEVEANNVMNRRRMTAEQRAATPPWATQDFPDEEQIVRTRIRRPMHAPRGLLY